jgi:DNA-binding XRE family transcriptional regulator
MSEGRTSFKAQNFSPSILQIRHIRQYLLTIQLKQYIFIDIMGKKSVTLLPKTGKILEQMGEQIRLARMRRKISVALAAERAGVSRASVWAVEKGSAAVAIGIYAAVLHAISGMDTDLLKVAADDELGQKLHDIELLKKYHPEGK